VACNIDEKLLLPLLLNRLLPPLFGSRRFSVRASFTFLREVEDRFFGFSLVGDTEKLEESEEREKEKR
jgi:hypothetical protein